MDKKVELANDIQTLVESYVHNISLGNDCKNQRIALINKLYEYQSLCMDMTTLGFLLIQTFEACIKSYNPSKQNFLNYFNFVFAKNIKIDAAKEKESLYRGGIKIDSQSQDLIRSLIKYAKSRNADIHDLSFQEIAAKYLKKSLLEIQESIDINDNATLSNLEISNEEGDSINIMDMQPSNEISPEEKFEQDNSVVEFFNKCERAYDSIQERDTTKAIIRHLLTSKILEEFGPDPFILEEMNKKRFCSRQVVKSYMDTGKGVSARQLAKELNIHEASISRTFKNFINKCKNC